MKAIFSLMHNMRLANIVIAVTSFTILVCVFWFNRSLFFKQYEPEYMEDFYSHSQWSIPLSTRIMGDGELYQYTGYSLIHGADPFTVNPEVPPLGKYLLGVSIALFNNPFVLNIGLYFFALLLYFKILIYFPLLQKKFLTVVVLASFPLFFSQVFESMLDLPQLIALLWHVLCVLKIFHSSNKKDRLINSIAAGIALGLVASIKIGIVVPLILFSDWHFLRKKNLSKHVFVVAGAGAVLYLVAYFRFLLLGHNLIDWIKSQLWVFHFYWGSEVKANPLVVISTIFAGMFRGWWGESWSRVSEWTILWPISVASLFMFFLRKRKSTQQFSHELTYISIISISLLLFFFIVPFWPRYFLIVFPFLLLLFFHQMHNSRILYAVIFLSLFQSMIFILPTTKVFTNKIEQRWNSYMFQEMFERISFDSSISGKSMDRKEFQKQMQKVLAQMHTDSFSAKVSSRPCLFYWSKCEGKISITYNTPLGNIHHESPANFINTEEGWKLVWAWDYLLPQYSADSSIIFETDFNEGIYVQTKDKVRVMEKTMRPFLSFIPSKFTDAEKAIQEASLYTDAIPGLLRPVYLVKYQGSDDIVPVGFILPDYDPVVRKRIEEGAEYLQIDYYPSNHIVEDFKQFKLLKKLYTASIALRAIDSFHGGRIYLRQPNNDTKMILQAPAASGDIQTLPYTLQEIEAMPEYYDGSFLVVEDSNKY